MGGLISDLAGKIDLTKYYRLERLVLAAKAPAAAKNSAFMLNCGDISVPVRIYTAGRTDKIIVFIHGGGWVTESAASYDRVCRHIMQTLGMTVISVDYSLSPEHRYPTALNECYAAVRETVMHSDIFGITEKDIILCGDSAGGNICAALSLLARDKGEFTVPAQILIYPVTNCDYSAESPFASVHEKAEGHSLTSRHMRDYVTMYSGTPDDLNDPYFAPLKASSFEDQPKTLVITAENDPLRDEGEAYAEKLRQAGNDCVFNRIDGAEHGFFKDMLQPYFGTAMKMICNFAGR